MLKLSECFTKAAELIERNGWIKGAFYTPKLWKNITNFDNRWQTVAENPDDYSYCLMGACRTACPEQEPYAMAWALGFKETPQAYDWNDYKATGKEEVIELLRTKAAELAEKGD